MSRILSIPPKIKYILFMYKPYSIESSYSLGRENHGYMHGMWKGAQTR